VRRKNWFVTSPPLDASDVAVATPRTGVCPVQPVLRE